MLGEKMHGDLPSVSKLIVSFFVGWTSKNDMRIFLLDSILVGLACLALSVPAFAGTVEMDVPDRLDSNAKYLFYMHGLAIELGGRQAKSYNYAAILEELARRGFIVIGEERSRVRSGVYAEKVAVQVRKLLDAGVPAKNITVAGHSKGGLIAMLVMSMLANPEIAYINFAGCGSDFEGYQRFTQNRGAIVRGRLLSAYDRSDQIAGSCQSAFDSMPQALVTERVLNIGGGHELFYTPKAEWLDILQTWAERQQK